MIKRKRTNNDLQNATQKTHLFYTNIQDIIVSNDYSAVDILYVIFKKKNDKCYFCLLELNIVFYW